MKVLYKRGSAQENDQYLGEAGEITIDLTNRTLRIHDGVRMGGIPIVAVNAMDKATVETLISSQLYLHTVSGDHDSRYYRIPEVDTLLSQKINSLTHNVDAQDVTLKIGNEQTYGWRDILGDIVIHDGGIFDVSSPPFNTFRNGIRAYEFRARYRAEFWCQFHIDHDYALGTNVYPHVHWAAAGNGSGVVRWGMEFTVAKGYAQASGSVFGPTSIVYAETHVPSGSQYKHFITEVNPANSIPASQLEPDSIVLVRFFRDGPNDSYGDSVYGFKADLHYQVARMATKNKSPNFFG